MSQFTRAREIASWYHSPGPAGIGFAVFASRGIVTDELWENISRVEREAASDLEPDIETKMHQSDMRKIRAELTAMGYQPPATGE
jgi:hypothetical protein